MRCSSWCIFVPFQACHFQSISNGANNMKGKLIFMNC